MAQNIKELLRSVLENQNNWKITLLKNWPSIIGGLNHKVKIEKIRQDTLILGVYDSCWLQELYLLSPILLKTINEKLEKGYIKKVRFKQIGIKKTKKIRKNQKQTIGKKNIRLTKKEEETLKKIKDPGLEKALREFLIRCHCIRDL